MRWILFPEKSHVRVGLGRCCLCSLGSPELPRQSYLHPHLRIYPDYLLFCRNMYSLRTKIESCEFSLLNTCQNQYWNITAMGNSTDTKYLLKHLFRMLTLSILWTTDDRIRQEDMVCCCRPGVARLVQVKSAVGTAGPGSLSLFSGRRRGLGLYKSAQRSVEKWRLLGSLVSRFGQ